jgi:hypothetical protein
LIHFLFLSDVFFFLLSCSFSSSLFFSSFCFFILLLKKGAEVNEKNESGYTALMYAAKYLLGYGTVLWGFLHHNPRLQGAGLFFSTGDHYV